MHRPAGRDAACGGRPVGPCPGVKVERVGRTEAVAQVYQGAASSNGRRRLGTFAKKAIGSGGALSTQDACGPREVMLDSRHLGNRRLSFPESAANTTRSATGSRATGKGPAKTNSQYASDLKLNFVGSFMTHSYTTRRARAFQSRARTSRKRQNDTTSRLPLT